LSPRGSLSGIVTRPTQIAPGEAETGYVVTRRPMVIRKTARRADEREYRYREKRIKS